MNHSPESLSLDRSVDDPSAVNSIQGDAAAVDVEGQGKEQKLLPRETGHDIGMSSPVPLSEEAVGVITRLRNMKVRGFFLLIHAFFVTLIPLPRRMKMRIGHGGVMSFF